MRLRQWVVSIGILLYIFCTLSAWTFTLFRWSPFSAQFVRFFYGMMAPYQNYSLVNVELTAEGQTDEGNWESINLDPYFPVSQGERAFRSYMITFRVQGPDALRRAYTSLAESIRTHEAGRGWVYQDVRLTYTSWPVSPEGFEALRLPAFIKPIDLLALE